MSGGNGLVNITISDGGAASLNVPASTIQLVMGVSSATSSVQPAPAVVNQIVSTSNPATLVTQFGYGPLVEAAALVCNSGGIVLAVLLPIVSAGTCKPVQFTGTGSTTITTSVDGTVGAYDQYYVVLKCISGGTIGTGPITFQVSLDAGRNFGPTLNLGTANTYAIPNTGITLDFGAGTLVTGDSAQFQTIAPAPNNAGILAGLGAFYASQYAGSGIGSAHIVGVAAGSEVSAIAGDGVSTTNSLQYLANNGVFTRCFFESRDAAASTAWGGAGETQAAWVTSIESDFSAVSAKRACVSAGYYNMPSAIANPAAGTPFYRRPLSFAAAASEVTVTPQISIAQVSLGAQGNIIVNPTTDPLDGFIYYDARVNPGLNPYAGGRFMTARTRLPQLPGFYIDQPALMSPPGSSFTILPYGSVMDVACSIVLQVGQQLINSTVRLNPNGTLYVNDALNIQNLILNAINQELTNAGWISSAVVTVDQTNNVQLTDTVNISVLITGLGYVEQLNVAIGYSNPLSVAASV